MGEMKIDQVKQKNKNFLIRVENLYALGKKIICRNRSFPFLARREEMAL